MTENPIRLTIECRIEAIPGTAGAYGQLQIREDLTLPVSSFGQLAEVIGRFHELGQSIAAERLGGLGGQGSTNTNRPT
jgi:hypothetical protein